MSHDKNGQYNCILNQTASSEFKVISRDRVSNIHFKMHMFMLLWDLTLGFMQCLDHLKFLENLLGVEHEGHMNADCRRPIFDVNYSMKINAPDHILSFMQYLEHPQFLEYLMGV